MNHILASDNCSGVHPHIMKALEEANFGHALPYGDDPFSLDLESWARRTFGDQALIFPVLTGTGANVLAMASGALPFNSIICADTAHVNVDECGAPQRFIGARLLPVSGENGKVTPENLAPALTGFGFQHHSQPSMLTISQATEFGTLYSLKEIRQLADMVHSRGMLLHMDGARLSNAAAALDVSFREMTLDSGVDILSLGGTKNGMMYGEAVVFINPEPAKNFLFIRKQAMQLASKSRYIAAQILALYDSGLWLENASRSNGSARLLSESLQCFSWVRMTRPVDTNMVFAIIPPEIREELLKKRFFYVWNEITGEVRWMTSWDTDEGHVEEFIMDIREAEKCLGNC